MDPSQVIGMSVPAVGGMSMYRNPIDEVARFFRTYHADAFMLFNCTSECSYPVEPFNGQVGLHPTFQAAFPGSVHRFKPALFWFRH